MKKKGWFLACCMFLYLFVATLGTSYLLAAELAVLIDCWKEGCK